MDSVETDLFGMVETADLEWIPANSRLFTVRLLESVGIQKDSCVKRNLFVFLAYCPTDCSAEE